MGKYTRELLEPVVASSLNHSEVVRKLGLKLAGGTSNHLKKVIQRLGIPTDHFRPWLQNSRPSSKKKKAIDVLIRLPHGHHRPKAYQLRDALVEIGVNYACGVCGITKWMGKEIVLEVDHIDGDFLNNLPDNLRFICPNCHSQTPTYKARNITDGLVHGQVRRS